MFHKQNAAHLPNQKGFYCFLISTFFLSSIICFPYVYLSSFSFPWSHQDKPWPGICLCLLPSTSILQINSWTRRYGNLVNVAFSRWTLAFPHIFLRFYERNKCSSSKGLTVTLSTTQFCQLAIFTLVQIATHLIWAAFEHIFSIFFW